MVRGVVVVIITAFTLAIALLVATAILEPIAAAVKSYPVIDQGQLNGTTVINEVMRVILQWMPVIVLGGMSLWAFRWYLKQERTVRRRR